MIQDNSSCTNAHNIVCLWFPDRFLAHCTPHAKYYLVSIILERLQLIVKYINRKYESFILGYIIGEQIQFKVIVLDRLVVKDGLLAVEVDSK